MEMKIFFEGAKKVNALYKGHLHRTDQPVAEGGENSAPSPFDVFLASIGTCAGFYVKTFCDQRGIPADKIKLIQTLEVDREKHLISKIKIDIKLPPDFPEKYRESLINVAGLCTVKRTIANPPSFEIITTNS
jgi:ribosomal protein S12 methylthiotransferase accessory factor